MKLVILKGLQANVDEHYENALQELASYLPGRCGAAAWHQVLAQKWPSEDNDSGTFLTMARSWQRRPVIQSTL